MREAKRMLRSAVKAKINELPESYICESNSKIREKFLASEEYKSSNCIFAYYSVGREVDTREIILRALQDGKRVALPVSLAAGKMIFREIHDLDHMKPGLYGIPEPDLSCRHIECGDGDLIIVPALSCDSRGNRLGRGAGYYDRFLENHNCVSVCLIRSRQMNDNIPTDKYDRRVQIVINEK
ncbi:MAG: 5-formyltetrahydrofolate cyclo-ligase [Bacillota bacterium]|nr:5-formyltetrahydrofolate cyclo-ligase [Bacillota bacterium]